MDADKNRVSKLSGQIDAEEKIEEIKEEDIEDTTERHHLELREMTAEKK